MLRAFMVTLFAVNSILATAQGDVIFDNNDPVPFQAGLISSRDNLVGDDFVLEEGANVLTDIHWWGYYSFYDLDDAFTVYIYDDLESAPIHTIDGSATVREATGVDLSPGPGFAPEFTYTLEFAPITLTAGQTYWLVIYNAADTFWFWSLSSVSGGNAVILEPPGQGTHWELAFNLTGPVVPEPSSLLVMGGGLASLYFGRRKWTQR